MKRRKSFLIISIIFLALLLYASYDINRKTTFPGSRPQLQERLKKTLPARDSAAAEKPSPETKD
jgi:hypothetical protein